MNRPGKTRIMQEHAVLFNREISTPRFNSASLLGVRDPRQHYESSRQSLDHVKPYKATKTKQTSGTTKPMRMEYRSAIWPMNGAAIAPPTIDITMSDEPSFVYSPRPRMPSAKIVGKPTDMKKNVPNIAY